MYQHVRALRSNAREWHLSVIGSHVAFSSQKHLYIYILWIIIHILVIKLHLADHLVATTVELTRYCTTFTCVSFRGKYQGFQCYLIKLLMPNDDMWEYNFLQDSSGVKSKNFQTWPIVIVISNESCHMQRSWIKGEPSNIVRSLCSVEVRKSRGSMWQPRIQVRQYASWRLHINVRDPSLFVPLTQSNTLRIQRKASIRHRVLAAEVESAIFLWSLPDSLGIEDSPYIHHLSETI